MTPVVSVLITHLDRPDVLERCVTRLQAALAGVAHEIVVADDHSTPEVVERLRSIGGIRLLTSERRLGLGANQNRAIDAATAEHLLVVQDDHEVARDTPDFLLDGIAVLDAAPDIALLRYEVSGIRAREVRRVAGRDVEILDSRLRVNRRRALDVYSDWPHLVRRRFHAEDAGRYLEGRSMGVTELEFAFRVHAKDLTVGVLRGQGDAFRHLDHGRSTRVVGAANPAFRRRLSEVKGIAAYGAYRATGRFPYRWYEVS